MQSHAPPGLAWKIGLGGCGWNFIALLWEKEYEIWMYLLIMWVCVYVGGEEKVMKKQRFIVWFGQCLYAKVWGFLIDMGNQSYHKSGVGLGWVSWAWLFLFFWCGWNSFKSMVLFIFLLVGKTSFFFFFFNWKMKIVDRT